MTFDRAAHIVKTMGTPRDIETDAYYFAHGRRADIIALATRILARRPRHLVTVA